MEVELTSVCPYHLVDSSRTPSSSCCKATTESFNSCVLLSSLPPLHLVLLVSSLRCRLSCLTIFSYSSLYSHLSGKPSASNWDSAFLQTPPPTRPPPLLAHDPTQPTPPPLPTRTIPLLPLIDPSLPLKTSTILSPPPSLKQTSSSKLTPS